MNEAQVKLSAVELAALQRDFPALPQDYLDYLTRYGWGMTPSGRMLYSGPIGPEEIFGEAHELPGVVLLGDDLAGSFLPLALKRGNTAKSINGVIGNRP